MLAILAYRENFDIRLVYGLLAIATCQETIRGMLIQTQASSSRIPFGRTIRMSDGYILTLPTVQTVMDQEIVQLGSTKFANIPAEEGESQDDARRRRRAIYNATTARDKLALSTLILT